MAPAHNAAVWGPGNSWKIDAGPARAGRYERCTYRDGAVLSRLPSFLAFAEAATEANEIPGTMEKKE